MFGRYAYGQGAYGRSPIIEAVVIRAIEVCTTTLRVLTPRRVVASLMAARRIVGLMPRRTATMHCDEDSTP